MTRRHTGTSHATLSLSKFGVLTFQDKAEESSSRVFVSCHVFVGDYVTPFKAEKTILANSSEG